LPGEHTGTFRGQDISFIAGDQALTYFDDDELMQTVKAHGAMMADSLRPLVDRHPLVNLTGKGMILGLDVGNGDRAKQIVSQCFESGLMIASCGTGGRVVKLIPPLTTPQADLEEGLQILIKATDNVMMQEAA
jgi:diaminobutyrate-2-oxoglutarate transaminase